MQTFEQLFQIYPCRNSELRSVARQCHEFGFTIAREPSAGQSSGLDSHALRRQRSYVEHATKLVEAMKSKPLPDLPGTHPTSYNIDLTQQYQQFIENLGGNRVPINETTSMIAEKWMQIAVELAVSQSASLAGSLTEHDFSRATNNLESLSKMLDEAEDRPSLDLPETAQPGASLQVTGATGV